MSNAICYAKFHSRSHDAVIRVYDVAGNALRDARTRYDVDILSSDASARELAMQKVASHLKTAHTHALTDVPT